MNNVSVFVMTTALFTGAVISVAAQAACTTDITPTAPDSRYTNNNDETVTDNITGLMWKQCSEGQSTTSTACDAGVVTTYSWQQSLQQAGVVNNSGGFAGFSDWRLPNRNEMASLVERECFTPAINLSFFPNTPSSTARSVYWTSTPYRNDAGFQWAVYFFDGSVERYIKGLAYAVRLVRGGL